MPTSTVFSCLPIAPHGAPPAKHYLESLYTTIVALQREKRLQIVKLVQATRCHYSVALLSDQTLMYFCPEVPELHRAIVDVEEEVIDVAAGAYHFVCCTTTGAVYSFGCDNKYGQLGDATVWQEGPLSPPRRLPGFGPPQFASTTTRTTTTTAAAWGPARALVCIVAVACGEMHTLLLPEERNRLYACGRGDSGQLGDGRTLLQPSCRSVRLLYGLPIAAVAAAGDHSLVLLRTGRLLAFGDNGCGQLGQGHTRQVLSPEAVAVVGSSEATGAAGVTTGSVRRRQLLDAKAFSSLRAPYATAESMQYPLRTERLSADLPADEVAVAAVYSGPTRSIVRAVDGTWYSCGLAPTKAWSADPRERLDGYGAIGRPLASREDAYRFGRMAWAPRLPQGAGACGDARGCACWCYPGLTALHLGGGGSGPSLLLAEGHPHGVNYMIGFRLRADRADPGRVEVEESERPAASVCSTCSTSVMLYNQHGARRAAARSGQEDRVKLDLVEETEEEPAAAAVEAATPDRVNCNAKGESVTGLHLRPGEDDSTTYNVSETRLVLPLKDCIFVL